MTDKAVPSRFSAMETELSLLPDYIYSKSRPDLNDLLRHGHIIPVSRAYTSAYVEKYYPGWTWNRLIAVFRAADVMDGGGGAPPRCKQEVVRVEFDGQGRWRVEWEGGRVTQSPRRPGARMR